MVTRARFAGQLRCLALAKLRFAANARPVALRGESLSMLHSLRPNRPQLPPSFGGSSENPATYRYGFAIRKTSFGPVVPGSAIG